MNVNNNLQGLQQLFSNQDVTSSRGKASGARDSATNAGTDQTTLSPAASLAAAAAAAPDSDVRTEKVAAIQQALAAGTYNVPATKVADKMIDQMMTK